MLFFFFAFFTQTLTSALLLPPFVMSMPSVGTLADLIPVLARLVTLVTAKLAKVGGAPAVCTARGPVLDSRATAQLLFYGGLQNILPQKKKTHA